MDYQLLVTAARVPYRFPTPKGSLGFEDLWDLSLSQLDATNLTLQEDVVDDKRKSLARTRTTPQDVTDRLAIVEFVYQTKEAEAIAAKNAADRKAEAQELMQLIKGKQKDALAAMSVEDLQKKLDALTGATS